MSTHKHFDKICCVVISLILIVASVFSCVGTRFASQSESGIQMEYEDTLFDTSLVHTLNIVMDDWDGFIKNCQSEEYYACTVEIDNETCHNVAIRGKGNTSLSQVPRYGNDRYSFKIEFDHYDNANTYYGLDKLCLNNIIQDNTFMKDYLTYQMMREMGAPSPLCSFVYITVNGKEWGLYLAVEGVEESFLTRNFGTDYGELYKPDSINMGGGRGYGGKFDMDKFMGDFEDGEMPNFELPTGEIPAFLGEGRVEFPVGEMPVRGEKGMMGSSSDVLLRYTDDNEDSYKNIFGSAKTNITTADKRRLIQSLKKLSEQEDLEDVLDIDSLISYFVVHNFV